MIVKFANRPIKISHLQLGVVVEYAVQGGHRQEMNRFGHIVGFTPSFGELMMRVLFAGDKEYTIVHPANLNLLDL